MKRTTKHLIITLFTFLNTYLFAQWTQFPSIPVDHVNAVRAWDQNTIYATQYEQILRSTNGGTNWSVIPIVNSVGTAYMGTSFLDIQLLSAGEIIAVGYSSLGNQEIIYKSTDFGATWSVVNINNNGAYPRTSHAVHFSTNSIGYVVGTNGRILKTTDSGNSWNALNSGVTSELRDVYFTNSNTGYAVGNGRILNTTNGGLNWTSTITAGSFFYAVHFPSANVGYAVGEDKVFAKTTNGGASWSVTPLNIPSTTHLTSVFFLSDTEGYVTGSNGRVYRTTSGGQYWEEIGIGSSLNDVFFLDPNKGYLAGNSGQLLQTSGTVVYQPIANFSSSSISVCNDSTLTFTNHSDPSFTSQWYINGVPFSSTYNTSYTFTNPSQNDVISLVISNGVDDDTLGANISVQADLDFTLTGGIQSTTLCSGQTTNLYVYNSIPGIVYNLTLNGTQIGTSQNGNGNTLTFNTGAVTMNATYCVNGVKTVPGCGSNTETWCAAVTLQNPSPIITIVVPQDSVCINSAAAVNIINSQSSISYQLYSGTTPIGSAQIGSGGILNFTTSNISMNTSFFIRATSPLGCVLNFPTFTIITENPIVYWSPSTNNPEVNENVDFISNVVSNSSSFLWNFGPNAVPTSSSSSDPQNVLFTTTGIQNITLTYTSSLGCTSSLSKQIKVIPTVTSGNCDAVFLNSIGSSGAFLVSTHRDKFKNLYGVYKHSQNAQNHTHSYHNDSLNLGIDPIPNFNHSITLIKYNPKGVPMWRTLLRSNTSGAGGDVTTDTLGNIYIAYFHNDYDDSLRIYSSDGRFISIMPPHSGSLLRSVVIVKYDPNGMYLWHAMFLDHYTVSRISVKADKFQNIFVSGVHKIVKYNSSGVFQWQNPGYFIDVEPDNEGGVYALQPDDLTIYHYNASGTNYTSSYGLQPLVPNSYVNGTHLVKDPDGGIYVAGNFRGSLVFGVDTITDINPTGDAILAKYSKDLEKIWIKQFKGSGQMPIHGLDVENNTVLLAIFNIGATFEYMEADTLFTNAENSYFLFTCDTLGLHGRINEFYNSSATVLGSNDLVDNLVLYENGTKFDFGFQYTENFTASSGTSFTTYPSSGAKYWGINLAEITCVFPPLPPSNQPIAYFQGPLDVCLNTPFQFTDASLNNPTQWYWTFQNANVQWSTDQNPTVTFNFLGISAISLTVSNAYGQSWTYLSYVNVHPAPSALITGTSWHCQGDTGTAEISTNSQFIWSDGNTSVQRSIGPLFQDSTISALVYDIDGCSIVKNYTFHVDIAPAITMSSSLPDTMCSSDSYILLPTPSVSGGTFSSNYGGITGPLFIPGSAQNGASNEILYTYLTPNALCPSYWQDSIFIISGDLTAFINAPADGCQGESITFNANVSPSVTNVLWEFESGISPDLNSFVTTAQFDSSGWFIIGLTASNDQCYGTYTSHYIYIEPAPVVEITEFSNDTICSNAGLISVPSASPSGGYYYDLLGAMTSATTMDPTLMANGQTNYIYYYYENASNCSNIDSTQITVLDCMNLENADDGFMQISIAASDSPNEFILLNLQAGDNLTIINSLGQEVLKSISDGSELLVNLANFAPGIYLISVNNSAHNSVIRIYNP